MKKSAESVLAKARANNEPVLVLRAQDYYAMSTVNHYYRLCEARECDERHLDGLFQILKDFAEWKRDNYHKMKIPD